MYGHSGGRTGPRRGRPPEPEPEHIYDTISEGGFGSRSSSSTLLAAPAPEPEPATAESDTAAIMARFNQQIMKIQKDCERKEEFLRSQILPAYLSSPPKDIERSPRGIAALASTMPPPPVRVTPQPREPTPPKAPAKNFFMDIYAQEVNKLQSSAAPVARKKKFDASQFNAYGLPLGEC